MMELGDEMYAHMASVELSKDVMIVSDAGGNLTTPVRPPASVAKGSKEKKELLANLQTKRANLAQSGQVRNDKISEAIVRNNRDNAFERLHKVIHQDEQLHAEKDQYEMEMSEIGNEPSGEDLLRLKRLKRKHAGVEERLVLNKRHKAYLEKETTCTDKALF
jgi:long-subunit acyl-CoA synthetase (AMP-forming)